MGRLGKTDWLSKYFKISSGRLEQIRGFAAGRGAVAAFFGFLPAVGDVIVFVLGLFKANLTVVAFSMFVGKFLRYCLLAYGVLQGIEWLGARRFPITEKRIVRIGCENVRKVNFFYGRRL